MISLNLDGCVDGHKKENNQACHLYERLVNDYEKVTCADKRHQVDFTIDSSPKSVLYRTKIHKSLDACRSAMGVGIKVVLSVTANDNNSNNRASYA